MIAMFRHSRGRTMIAAVLASGACVALTAPAASATTPPPGAQATCMVAANNGYAWTEDAISADQAGNAAAAAADDSTAIGYVNPVTSECYYVNPTWIYNDILNASEELQSAQSANASGNTTSALSTEQSVAPVLYDVFITLFNKGP
jgi:hypothetical protein